MTETQKADADASPSPSMVVPTLTGTAPGEADRPFSTPARVGLILLATALLWLALPPVGLAPLALVAPVPFLLALRGRTPREALGTGFAYGLACSCANASWFLNVFSVPFAAPLWLLLALFPAAYGFGHAVAARRGPVAVLVAGPALWLALDWIRSEGWHLRFAWFTLGHALAGDPLLRQNADLAGVYGLTLFALVVSFLIERAIAWRRDGRVISLVILVLALPFAAYGRGNRALGFAPPLHEVKASREGLSVLGVQDEHATALEGKARLSEAALDKLASPPDVILWPECSLFRDYTARPDDVKAAQRVAARSKAGLIFGVMRPCGQKDQKDRVWNAAIVMKPDGAELGEYHKRVPVQFVEANVVAGDAPGVFTLAGRKVGVLTCYDGTYPFVTRQLAQAGAEVILTPSMDVAEWGRVQHAHHALFYPLRACEVRRSIVRAASSGVSVALDPWGRELARVDAFDPGTLTAVVPCRQGDTLYVRGGWLLPFFAMAVVAAMAIAALTAKK